MLLKITLKTEHNFYIEALYPIFLCHRCLLLSKPQTLNISKYFTVNASQAPNIVMLLGRSKVIKVSAIFLIQ